jgi:hypothetical protein
MLNFQIEVEFEVFCFCGKNLRDQVDTRGSSNRRIPQIVVSPCPRCLEEAYAEGEKMIQDSGEGTR